MKIKVIISVVLSCLLVTAQAQMRIGIIGLDTSHSVAFAKFINGEMKKDEFKDFRITSAYPYGSKTIKSSFDRIHGYIEQIEKLGVEIAPSIAALLEQVDCVLLETNDGNLHLEQAYEVFKAGKIVFIDKPVGANLAQAIAIFELAKQYNVPVFSASSLRYVSQTQKLRNGEQGKIYGADCYSPAHLEPSHADMAWYGIHGVEMLFTVMGTGCVSANRTSSEGTDFIVGLWDDGRIGTVRGSRVGKNSYGGRALTDEGVISTGTSEGYEPLLREILDFFRSGISPVSKKETLEIFTFMEAADISKNKGGRVIPLDKTFNKSFKEAQRLIRTLK